MSLQDYLEKSFDQLISRKATVKVQNDHIAIMFGALVIRYNVYKREISIMGGIDHMDIASLVIALVRLYEVDYLGHEN